MEIFFSAPKRHKMLLLTINSSILVGFPNKLFENDFQLWFTVAWLVHTWRIAPNSVSLVLFTLCYLGWKTMEIDGENWTQDIGGQPNPAGSFCQFFFFRFQKRIRVRLLWFTRIQKDCYLTSVLKSKLSSFRTKDLLTRKQIFVVCLVAAVLPGRLDLRIEI